MTTNLPALHNFFSFCRSRGQRCAANGAEAPLSRFRVPRSRLFSQPCSAGTRSPSVSGCGRSAQPFEIVDENQKLIETVRFGEGA
jgi:hypothetical protein